MHTRQTSEALGSGFFFFFLWLSRRVDLTRSHKTGPVVRRPAFAPTDEAVGFLIYKLFDLAMSLDPDVLRCCNVMMFYDWRECVLDGGCTDLTPQNSGLVAADPLLAITET